MQDGLLVIEAEHFHARRDLGGHGFRAITRPHGFAGDGALIALPDLETNRDADPIEGPRVDFHVELPAGTYHVWLRGHAYGDGDDDSVHAGFTLEDSRRITFADTAEWTWSRTTMDGANAILEITEDGPRTLSIWMREDGTIIDRILLASDPSYVPSGEGPPESPRAGGTMETPDAGVPDTAPSADAGDDPPDAATDAGSTTPPDPESCACTSTERRGGLAPAALLGFALVHVLARSLQARPRLRRPRSR
jgi:hypothetical protein